MIFLQISSWLQTVLLLISSIVVIKYFDDLPLIIVISVMLNCLIRSVSWIMAASIINKELIKDD